MWVLLLILTIDTLFPEKPILVQVVLMFQCSGMLKFDLWNLMMMEISSQTCCCMMIWSQETLLIFATHFNILIQLGTTHQAMILESHKLFLSKMMEPCLPLPMLWMG